MLFTPTIGEARPWLSGLIDVVSSRKSGTSDAY